MQAALQPHVDSSISKTINLPEDISFEAFRDVYARAFALGLKGCTTYRPNDVTGAVLAGAVIGESLRIERGLEWIGSSAQERFGGGDGRFAEGFVIASLVFCVGPLTIVGSIEDGLGDPELLFVKSGLDGFAMILITLLIYGGLHAPEIVKFYGLRAARSSLPDEELSRKDWLAREKARAL